VTAQDAVHILPALESPFSPGAWRQPPREAIEIDGTHALMSQQTFQQLSEYSATIPSGVYPGKMWRRHDGIHDPTCPASRRRWLLCWYGPAADPTICTINMREVLLV
jgi:hypothetical protein